MAYQLRSLGSDYDDTLCPVPEHVFSSIHRATPQEAAVISRLLPDVQRARLALFCYSRNHLRETGRAIATVCNDQDLIREGGIAGQALIAQRLLPKTAFESKTRAKITLATPAMRHHFAISDFGEDEEEVA